MAISYSKTPPPMNKNKDLIGRKFGRWTVLEKYFGSGERKWLCRCDCGTERYVLERSLIYGASKSCGCLTRERSSAAISHELTGQKFGEFTVLHKMPGHKKGNVYWLCRCSCGKEVVVPATLLYCGRKTSCGCKTEHHYASSDITGKKFNRITALYPTEERTGRGSVIWHCRCDCGTELDVSYNSLVYSNMKSCGCQKKENDQKIREHLTFVDGTSVDSLKSKKIPKNNTTGVKGVYFIRNKYTAKIVFQKKAYYLGTYTDIEEAAAARKCAEETLCDGAVAYYEKWKAKADSDPVWAEQNPIKFNVIKLNDRVEIQMLPVLD